MAYLNPGPDDRVVIDPDAIGVLVDEYPEEATRLLDPKQFDKYFQFRMHLSYKKLHTKTGSNFCTGIIILETIPLLNKA